MIVLKNYKEYVLHFGIDREIESLFSRKLYNFLTKKIYSEQKLNCYAIGVIKRKAKVKLIISEKILELDKLHYNAQCSYGYIKKKDFYLILNGLKIEYTYGKNGVPWGRKKDDNAKRFVILKDYDSGLNEEDFHKFIKVKPGKYEVLKTIFKGGSGVIFKYGKRVVEFPLEYVFKSNNFKVLIS